MVRQERDRRESDPGGNQREPRHLTGRLSEFAETAPTEARQQAARKIFEHEERLQAKTGRTLVRPGFRERVEETMRGEWREPVLALRLAGSGLTFEVPGRRADGSVKGKKLVRRFLWNIARGIGAAAAYILYLAHHAGSGGGARGEREIHVKGPANAMALDLIDRLRAANGPWLVCSPSALALVDTGSTITDPADAPPPQIIWQARKPQAPTISLRTRTITWTDGSRFTFPLHDRTEVQYLRKHYGPQDTIYWDGEWRSAT